MTQTIGTFSVADLLKSRFTAADIGFDAINQAIQAELAYRNAAIRDALGVLSEETVDSRRVWGTSRANEMVEVDEFTEADTQQPEHGVEIDFPMRRFSYAVGLTSSWLLSAQASEVAQVAMDAMMSYERRMQDEIQFAIYNNGNYDFLDRFGDRTTLAVKAFANADSGTYPNMLDGTAVAGTHQHYTGTAGASLAVADIDDVLDEVVEHGGMRDVGLYINESNVATLEALSSTKFTRLTPQVFIPANDGTGTIQREDVNEDPANKLVGYWGAGYPVYTRSWAITDHYAAIARNGILGKPLVYRVHKNAGARGLMPAVEIGMHPLIARYWNAYFGFGAWNRVAVAVKDGANQTTYTEPTLIR